VRRSYDLTRDLTILFICAVGAVLVTRSLLALAGYPQVGGKKFHIAHVLYGGLLLLVAVICLLAFLDPRIKVAVAIAGGIGFGLFIDEVGKFITKDVDYFYRPTFAIIYVCFVVLFFAIRWLGRRRFSADEAVLIGFEALQRAAVGSLTTERRDIAIGLLEQTDAKGSLAEDLRRLLDSTRADARPPSRGERAASAVGSAWKRLAAHPRFHFLVFAVLIASAAISGAELGWLLRNGLHTLPFSQKVFAVVTAVVDAMLLIGAIRLRQSMLSALHWYEHAVLLALLVGQVFLYTAEQLAATLNLFALLAVWAALHWVIRFELADAARPGSALRPGSASAMHS
jgi:hypothetical protein